MTNERRKANDRILTLKVTNFLHAKTQVEETQSPSNANDTYTNTHTPCIT